MDFRILGPLEAREEGRLVRLSGDKQRALLALFLLNRGETLTTDRLIDELWGERPPANAAKTVQMHISRLRKALGTGGGGLVVTRERGYVLELDPECLDAIRFERLVAEGRGALRAGRPERAAAALEGALSLWRGRPLADVAYEPFAQRHIGRLDDLRVAALEELIEARLALGAHAELVGQLEALIAEHPYRERPRAQLMSTPPPGPDAEPPPRKPPKSGTPPRRAKQGGATYMPKRAQKSPHPFRACHRLPAPALFTDRSGAAPYHRCNGSIAPARWGGDRLAT